MPNLVDWNKCCGCGACANKCPQNVIRMLPNQEGFLHPKIDSGQCIECGACEKVCPGLSPATTKNNNPKVYIVQHKDDDIRYQSTSGGAFTAIAEEIIRRGGVVFGAVLMEDFEVRHESVDTIEGLAKFRNSKYVQSKTEQSFREVKRLLDQDRFVCYSGTPCEINGLSKYLGRDYVRLLMLDVVCKSVPSPLFFHKYIKCKESQEGRISDVVFRDKKRGFLYCTMAHYSSHDDRWSGKSCYRRGSESDEWLRLFLSGKISRRSCMTCPFQTVDRVSDITLGDIWETKLSGWDDNKGTTIVHVWTKKGDAFLHAVKDYARVEEYPSGMKMGIQRKSIPIYEDERKKLFDDAHIMSGQILLKKYAPYTFLIKMKQLARYLMWKLGLHNIVRHVAHIVVYKKYGRR